MKTRLVGACVVAGLVAVSGVPASEVGSASGTPGTPWLQDMKVRIRSDSGKLQLFVGTELGQPANRKIGTSPEKLTIRCQTTQAATECMGTTNRIGEFWNGECLILALDRDDQEMILSGDLLCRSLGATGTWNLDLDFVDGTAVASVRNRGFAGERKRSAQQSTEASTTKGVSLIPERFSRRLSDSHQKKN